MKNSLFRYSRFIFLLPKIEVPTVSPKVSIEQKFKERKKKQEAFIKAKKKKLEAVKKLSSRREKLRKIWTAEGKEVKDDPKYIAWLDVIDPYYKKEIFLLLALIEKYWGIDKAREIADKCYKKKGKGYVFDLPKLRAFFSKENVKGKLPFYYQKNKNILWKYTPKWYKRLGPAFWQAKKGVIWKSGGLTGEHYHLGALKVTGWWTFDTDEKEIIPKSVTKLIKEKIKDRKTHGDKEEYTLYENLLKAEGYIVGRDPLKALKNAKGDELVGKSFLLKALPGIHREIYFKDAKGKRVNRDSGLDIGKEDEVKRFLLDTKNLTDKISVNWARSKVLKWLKENAKNQWVSLSKDIVGPMTVIYGPTCGKYIYRYAPDQKRIYTLGIEGVKVDPRFGKGSYIEIKNDKLGNWVGSKIGGKDAEKMLESDLIAKLSPKEISKELSMHRILSGEVTKEDMKTETQGLIASIKKLPPVIYSKLQLDYLDKLKSKLEELLNNKYKKRFGERYDKYKEKINRISSRFAQYRIDKIKKLIKDKADPEKDPVIGNLLSENPDTKVSISVDSNDIPSISVLNDKLVKKYRNVATKLKVKDLVAAKDLVKNIYAQIQAKIKNPFIFKLADSIFDFKKIITTGKTDWFTNIAMGFLGIGGALGAGKLMLGAKKTDQAGFDALIKGKKKIFNFNSKRVYTSNVRLDKPGDKRRVVIRKGLGIYTEKPIEIRYKNGKTDILRPKAGKEKEKGVSKKGGMGGLFSMFSGGEKIDFAYKDREFEITKTIPAGTVIPKGAKMVRV